MRVTIRVATDTPQPGEPVAIMGWEGGTVGPEMVKYLPGAARPIAVVWMPGGSVFAGRGSTRYHPSQIHVFELDGILEQVEAANGRTTWQAHGFEVVSFAGSYRRSKPALARSY